MSVYYSITHDILGDPFWTVYRRGVFDAARRFDIEVEHRAPEDFSIEEQSRLIDEAVENSPLGLIATIPDAEALDDALRRVAAADIPFIAVNAKDPRAAEDRIPYLCYVGGDDLICGRAAASRLQRASSTQSLLAVDHYLVHHTAHHARFVGAEEVMQARGGTLTNLRVDGGDGAAAADAVRQHLEEHPEVDAILSVGPPGAVAAMRALDALGRARTVAHATFDLSEPQLEGVRAGKILFTVDMQQYLQGYLGLELLWLHVEHGFALASDYLTGPAFVDRTNVDQVQAAVAAGRR